MKDGDDICGDSVCSGSSFEEDSATSMESSSSSDLVEDASSSSSSGPLYELSELMNQLPIKRGLSKYYQGKSQSYKSLTSVNSVEDLAKRGTHYRKKMKSCKSYAGGLDGHKFCTPKATISKKTSRGSFLSSLGNKGGLMSSCKSPIHVQKKF